MLEKHKTRTSAAFDPERKLVYGKSVGVVEGHELRAGDPIPEDLDSGVKRRLWLVRRAHYAEDFRPTPVDETADTAPGEQDPNLEEGDEWMAEADGVTITALDNGWYQLDAAWLAEPEKAHGKEAAKEKAAELRETRGFASEHKGGGKYEITGPGLTEPESVKGKDAAEARLAELRAAPPPPPADEAGDDTGE